MSYLLPLSPVHKDQRQVVDDQGVLQGCLQKCNTAAAAIHKAMSLLRDEEYINRAKYNTFLSLANTQQDADKLNENLLDICQAHRMLTQLLEAAESGVVTYRRAIVRQANCMDRLTYDAL